MILEVKNLIKTFDEKSLTIINNISFDLKKGEVLSVIGPSGTGKSTLAKIINGQVSLKSGEVIFKGKAMAYVPQEQSLDEEKTIFENISTYVSHETEDIIHVKVRDMIEVFGLQYKDHKFPKELSTGQKQRAQLAKALVHSPDLLILDEPFSNLDKSLREELKEELFEILSEREISCLMVTHDLDDAFSGSDRVIVMADGVIKQIGAPKEIYSKPASAYVARFSGAINLIAGPLKKVANGSYKIKNGMGEFEVQGEASIFDSLDFAYLAIRPEMAFLDPKGPFKGKVIKIRYLGPYIDLWLSGIHQNKFIIRVPYQSEFKLGDRVRFSLDNGPYLLPI